VLQGYFFDMPGAVISLSEQPGSIGTPDIVVVFDDGLYAVIELKYEKGEEDDPGSRKTKAAKSTRNFAKTEEEINKKMAKMANDALKAIHSKKYPRPYESRAKKVIKIGLGIYGRGKSLAIIKN
jgi:hypothetical protein